MIGVLKIMSQLPELRRTQMSFLLLTGDYNAPLFRRRVADQSGPGAKKKVGKFKGALA